MKVVKKFVVSSIAAAMLAVGGVATTAVEASAAVGFSPATKSFCKPDCAIDIPASTLLSGVTEGVAFPVNVTGKPGTTAKIRPFLWTSSGLKPIGNVVSVALPAANSATSFKRITMKINPLTAPLTSYDKVYIQPADLTAAHLKEGFYVETAPGSNKPLKFDVRSARAGDGGWKGELTNGVFHRAIDNGIPGHVYGVQMNYNGAWRDVTNAFGTISSRGVGVVQGKVPNLPTGKYYVRIYNKTKGIYDLTPPNGFYINVTAFDVYTTPGYWNHNGRHWYTTCEKYSATQRCRTEIYATTVKYINGRYVSTKGYIFNNLTYKPSPRSLWAKNPLGAYGKVGGTAAWTATDGAKWKTECDTASTGRGACRSYRWSQAIVATKTSSGAYSYRHVAQWVFNNIVRFS